MIQQCQETQPACENCTRKKIQCKYPAPKTLSALQLSSEYSSSPVSAISLQSTPSTFTLTDMRLFHHFLMFSYPHLPVGNDAAWVNQVPLIAHHVNVTIFHHRMILISCLERISHARNFGNGCFSSGGQYWAGPPRDGNTTQGSCYQRV